MILYYIEKDKITIVFDDKKQEVIKENIKKVIGKLCIDNLSTLEGRIYALKEKFKFKYNVPIYINNNIILSRINDGNIYYINIMQIKSVEKKDEGVEVVFKNGESLKLGISLERYNQVTKKARMVINYKNDLFFK